MRKRTGALGILAWLVLSFTAFGASRSAARLYAAEDTPRGAAAASPDGSSTSSNAAAATTPGAPAAAPGANAAAGAPPAGKGDSAPTATMPPFPAMQGILDEYRGLHVGAAYDASGREFKIGHLKLVFRSGTLTAIMTKSNRETGFIYSGGEGHYTYTTEDPGDIQSIGKNILKFVNTLAYRDGNLNEEMRSCVLVSSEPVLPELLGPGASAQGSTPGGAASTLNSFLKGVDDINRGLDHDAALAVLGSRPGRTVYAEIEGQSVHPGYSYDSSTLRVEALWLSRTVLGDRFSQIVSRQKIGADDWSSPIVLTRLEYELSTDNNHDATVKINETLEVRGPSGRLLPFLLINHADRAAKNWVSTKRTVEVQSIRMEGGHELSFSHRYHQLLVELPEAPPPGTVIKLAFDLALHFVDTGGDQYYNVPPGAGFPAPWWQNSIRTTSHWNVKTKKPYLAYTGGTVVARHEEGDSLRLESEVDTPTFLPQMIAGKFESKETEKNGLKLAVHIYGSTSSRATDSYIEAAVTALDVYGKMLVPYPRKEIDVLEFPFHGFYQSPAGLVLCSTDYPWKDSVVENRRADEQVRIFMHELAHQWFGNLVTPKSWLEDNWISESIAEYLGAVVYAGGTQDPRQQAEKMQYSLAQWRRDADMSKDSVSIAQAAYLRGEWTEKDSYIQLLYGKGPLVVHMLRTMLGNDRFFGLLKTITRKYANKMIDTNEFARETSIAAGQDMKWFFDQWIKQPGIPDLDLSKAIVQEGGKPMLTGHMKQRDPSHFKRLLVPFVFDLPGGQRGVKLVDMDKPDMDFKVELPAGAKNVVVDPGKNNLVYYH